MTCRALLLAFCLSISTFAQAASADPALTKQVNAFVDG